MNVFLDILMSVFFGSVDEERKVDCSEWETDDSVHLMSDDGEVELKPSGTYGAPLK